MSEAENVAQAPAILAKVPNKALETRANVRNYIHNERDTILRKWMALEEGLKAEDHRREQFLEHRLKECTTIIPLTVQKMIGSLKKAVRRTMREKGGTPYSITRALFLYWDVSNSGKISKSELKASMHSLGVQISEAEVEEVLRFYGRNNPGGEVRYQDILADISKNEPTLTQFVDPSTELDIGVRFEEASDKIIEVPETVKLFIEATKHFISNKMRHEGGTPLNHALKIYQQFNFADDNFDPTQLRRTAMKLMKMTVSDADAACIVDYYCRRGAKDFYHHFSGDVCKGIQTILSFTELSPEFIAEQKMKLNANSFITKPFQAVPNKLMERVKAEVSRSVNLKIRASGGSMRSWVTERFVLWDPRRTNKISRWQDMQGVLKGLGVVVSDVEAKVVIDSYDKTGSGEMYYEHLIHDLIKDEPHFIENATIDPLNVTTSTSRAPLEVQKALRRLRGATEAYARKSKGTVEPRDILHGTFLRFDDARSGRVDLEGLQSVADELGLGLKRDDLAIVLKWFDTDSSRLLDYDSLTTQLFGEDEFSKELGCILPSLARSMPNLNGGGGGGTPLSSSLDGSLPKMKAFQNLNGKAVGEHQNKAHMIETSKIKEARRRARRGLMLEERIKIREKLESIDRQRKIIIEDHKARSALKKDS